MLCVRMASIMGRCTVLPGGELGTSQPQRRGNLAGMGKILVVLVIGLTLGVGFMWWWMGARPRSLAQPSDSLAGWVHLTGTDSIPVASGGTTWIVGSEVRLRNITTKPVRLNVPAQRFVVVLGDGSTVVGRLAEALNVTVASQQTTAIPLPKVSFFGSSERVSGVVLVIDEGDGLRPIISPVGEEPKVEAKPEAVAPGNATK